MGLGGVSGVAAFTDFFPGFYRISRSDDDTLLFEMCQENIEIVLCLNDNIITRDILSIELSNG